MPVSYSAFQFSYSRAQKPGKQVDLGASDRENPISILPEKPDSSFIGDSFGVACCDRICVL
ncbi:FAST kinase domains 1 [Oscillatoria nigro-viridis PCC 7112]|uniref:FAST kinase domains 1 n=1 Tax=Phormidium nigroviride PCC 7112 TaxID=179408 RepID=K9VQX4_9CYAN|nr:FAST kinase domains 1 [Oscillatoria nigro-viridis PCC 7112]